MQVTTSFLNGFDNAVVGLPCFLICLFDSNKHAGVIVTFLFQIFSELLGA